jgi:hypothetical protein
MFNLGTKQLCLTVTRTLQKQMGNLHRRIRNFAIPTVAAAAGRQGISVAKCSGRCVHNHSGYTYDDTKTYDIVLFAQKEYCLISLVILMYGPI